MNKEKLVARVAELDQMMKQIITNYSSLDGARQECLRIMNEIDSEGMQDVSEPDKQCS